MGLKYANNAGSYITSALTPGSVTLTVQSGDGSKFPTLTVSDYFYGTLFDNAGNIEIVKVTARTGDVMTITRAQDSTTALSWASATRFELRQVAASLNDIVTTAATAKSTADTAKTTADTAKATADTAKATADGAIATAGAAVSTANAALPKAGGNLSGAVNDNLATVASAATTADIWGASGNVISFTGNASVTAFPNAPQAGAKRHLLITGTPTFVNSANLIVEGGADYICSPGDRIEVIAESTTVFRLAIKRANGLAVSSPKTIDYQVFTSSGTWNKPAGYGASAMARIQNWGGGGGGGGGTNTNGGGGGGYAELWIPLSSLGATETVTIGSGGALVNAGGASSFGSWLTAYGGGGGTSSSATGGGGGGSWMGVGANSSSATGAAAGGADAGAGGAAAAAGVAASGWGGGGGGGGGGTTPSGGKAMWGGGGGCGGNASGVGGTSVNGGKGGNNNQAGTAPGGGGGANAVGARGEIRVTVFP